MYVADGLTSATCVSNAVECSARLLGDIPVGQNRCAVVHHPTVTVVVAERTGVLKAGVDSNLLSTNVAKNLGPTLNIGFAEDVTLPRPSNSDSDAEFAGYFCEPQVKARCSTGDYVINRNVRASERLPNSSLDLVLRLADVFGAVTSTADDERCISHDAYQPICERE
jgi:hypothetical protein